MIKMVHSREGLGRAAAAGVLWGLTGVFARAAYNAGDIAPLLVSFLRMALAVPVLAIAWVLLERKGGSGLSGGARGRDGAAGLGEVQAGYPRGGARLFLLFGAVAATYQVLYFSAVSLTTVTSATLILALAPVFVALWGRIFLGEALERRVLLWGGVAVVGAILVALGGMGAPGGDEALGLAEAAKVAGVASHPSIFGKAGREQMQRMLVGDVLALGASVAYSLYYLLGRWAFRFAGPLFGSVRVFSWAALLLGGVVISTGQYHVELSAEGWLAVLLMGVVATGLAYVFYFTALATTGAVLVSLGGLLEPITAAVLSWAFFGESPGAVGWAGAAMLLLALGLLSAKRRPRVRAPLPPAPDVPAG